MTTALKFATDSQSFNTFSPVFTDEAVSVDLSALTPTSTTVPGSNIRYMAIFTYEAGAEVWVANGATAAVPAGATFASTLSSQNPVARTVFSGQILSFITPNASTSVGVEYFVVPDTETDI